MGGILHCTVLIRYSDYRPSNIEGLRCPPLSAPVQVSSQIRTLEAQLQSLRAQAAEIEDKRATLTARQRAAWENGGGAGGKSGRAQVRTLFCTGLESLVELVEVSLVDMLDWLITRPTSYILVCVVFSILLRQAGAPSLPPAHYRETLTLADSLAGLADPRRAAAASPEQILTVQTAQASRGAGPFSERFCCKIERCRG